MHIEQDGNPIGLPIESRAQLCVDPQSSSVDGNRVVPWFELPPGCRWGRWSTREQQPNSTISSHWRKPVEAI